MTAAIIKGRARVGLQFLKKLRTALPLCVLAALGYYFVTRVSWEKTAAALASVSPSVIALAIFINLIATVSLATAQYWMVERDAHGPTLRRVEAINSRVLAYSTVLPTALVAAYKITSFSKIFDSVSKAVAFFSVTKVCSLVVGAVTAAALLAFGEGPGALRGQFERSPVFILGFLAVAVFAALISNSDVLRKRIGSGIDRLLPERFSSALRMASSHLGYRAWGAGLLIQASSFVLVVAAAWGLACALDPDFPLIAIVFARVVTLIALLAPISVAGVGAREVSFLAVLPLFAVSSEDAAALVVLLLLTQWAAGLAAYLYSCALMSSEKGVK